MATLTLGTNATTTLTAVSFAKSLLPADMATMTIGIKDDLVNGHPTYPGAFSNNGHLYIPNRGWLRVRVGDYVAIDSQGWPILVSANSIANGPWTHS